MNDRLEERIEKALIDAGLKPSDVREANLLSDSFTKVWQRWLATVLDGGS